MPPQDPVQTFTPEVRAAFEAFLNGSCTRIETLWVPQNGRNISRSSRIPSQKSPQKTRPKSNDFMQKNAGQSKNFVWIPVGNSCMWLKKRGISPSRKPLSTTLLIILNGYMLQGVTMSIRRLFNEWRRKFLGYLELMFSGYLSIVRFVWWIGGIQREPRCNLLLLQKY